MYQLIGPRRGGKTTAIIQLSAEKNIPIAVLNADLRTEILRMAKKMELEIPMPLIFGNLRGTETVLIIEGYSWSSDPIL